MRPRLTNKLSLSFILDDCGGIGGRKGREKWRQHVVYKPNGVAKEREAVHFTGPGENQPKAEYTSGPRPGVFVSVDREGHPFRWSPLCVKNYTRCVFWVCIIDTCRKNKSTQSPFHRRKKKIISTPSASPTLAAPHSLETTSRGFRE